MMKELGPCAFHIDKVFRLGLDYVFLQNPAATTDEYIQCIIILLEKHNIKDVMYINSYLQLKIETSVQKDGINTITTVYTIQMTLNRLWSDYCKNQNKFYFEILSGNGCGLTMGSLNNYSYNYNDPCILGPIKFGGFQDPQWNNTLSMKKLNKNNQFNKNHNYLFQELHDIYIILENILNIVTK